MSTGETTSDKVRSQPPSDPLDPFVGRAGELRRVNSAAEALQHGRGQLVVVSGDAGAGKSRFCTEIARRSQANGARVVEARCWLDGGAPPLWPWQPILADLCSKGGSHLLSAGADVDDVGPDRFARFVAVSDCIACACAEGPVVLVIDDVQGADHGALLLLRFVARSLARFPMLIVLGQRRNEPPAGSEEARLLDEIEREATTIVLGGFDRDETETFLADHGVDTSDPDIVSTLFGLTRGHPLHLRRITQTLRTTGSTLPEAPHGGVKVAIRQAFDALGDDERRLLSYGALLGPDPVVAELAAVAGCDAVAVLAAAEAGAAAGLVTVHDDGSFSFTHELVRAAVEDHLSATERLDVHARAAAAVATQDGAERRSDRLARAAFHARGAAARSRADAQRAVELYEAAAQAMVRNDAYEQADELFGAAVELHTSGRLGRPSTLLMVQWAQAAALRGHRHSARERYGVAIAQAQAESQPALLVEAVLGWGGVWLDDYATPAEKARMLGLYRKALDGLPPDDPRFESLRCRVRVRLAGESTYDGGPVEELHDAVGKTRATGDHRALAETLAIAQHALFTHEHTYIRPPLNDELMDVTAETDQSMLAMVGLLWRTINQLHLGDPRFIRTLEVLRERAAVLGNDHMLYRAGVVDVLLAIGQGRLAEAEAEAARCYELGERIGRADAFAYYAVELAVLRWLQGRDAEMLDLVGEVAASPVLGDAEFSVWAMSACLAARAGDHDRARSILRHCVPADLGDLAPSGTWMAGMVALVEAAVALGDRDLAAQAYDLLTPHADLPAVAGLGIACLGSVQRSLGLAAGVLDHHDRAVAHLELAIPANHRIINRPVLALARAELAAALIRRPDKAPDDYQRAEHLLRQAIDDGKTFGLTGRVAIWEPELAAITALTTATPNSDTDPAVQEAEGGAETKTTGREGVVRQDGKRWVLAIDGRRIRVANLVGMRYIAELLTNPNKRIPAVTLTDQLPDLVQPHRQEVLDNQARSAYAARARDLAADLAEAEAANDLHRAELLRAEIDLLVDQIESATGIGGQPRHFPTDHERARVAVQKAIKRALDAVEDADLVLADLLRHTITTGVTCTYVPGTKAPVTWTTRDVHPDD